MHDVHVVLNHNRDLIAQNRNLREENDRLRRDLAALRASERHMVRASLVAIPERRAV